MNKGMMVLVGCVVGAGVLFYTSTGSSAARPPAASPTPRAERSAEVAHSGKTAKPADAETTAVPSATPTETRLTLAQVRNLPRPFVPGVLISGGSQPSGPAPGSSQPAATETLSPTETPAPSATPQPAGPPSEDPPPTAMPTATAPPPTATPSVPWWALPTPPPLPPYPDAGVAPRPPSE